MDTWDDSVTSDLGTHMARVLILLRRAEEVWFEHDYYHPYDFILNFNALRKSKGMERFFSIYPQARINSQPTKPGRVPEQVSSDRNNKGKGKNVDSATKSIGQLDLTQTSTNAGPSTEANPPLLRTVTTRSMDRPIPPPNSTRPPDSSASTSTDSSDTKEDQTRYPDFAFMMTTGAGTPSERESVHLLWEIKRPPAQHTSGSSKLSTIKSELQVEYGSHVRQVVEQAACAFGQFEHQKTMTVFVVLGYWLRALRFSRDNMPTQDTLEEAHQLSQKEAFKLLLPYFEESYFFYLLDKKKKDYSTQFKLQWLKTFNAVSDDVEEADAPSDQE